MRLAVRRRSCLSVGRPRMPKMSGHRGRAGVPPEEDLVASEPPTITDLASSEFNVRRKRVS